MQRVILRYTKDVMKQHNILNAASNAEITKQTQHNIC